MPVSRSWRSRGALFFGAANDLAERMEDLAPCPALTLSMRGVPMADASGVHALEHIWRRQQRDGGLLSITGLRPEVRTMFARAGLIEAIGAAHFLWSADQAISLACVRLIEPLPVVAGASYLDVEEPEELPFGVVPVAD